MTMAVRKRSYSLDSRAADYVDRRAKQLKRKRVRCSEELVIEAARQDARDRVLADLAPDEEIPEREVQRWFKRLGAL